MTIDNIDQVKSKEDLENLIRRKRLEIDANAKSIEQGLKDLYADRHFREVRALSGRRSES